MLFFFVLLFLIADLIEDEKSQEQIISYTFGVLSRKDEQCAATYVILYHDLCWAGGMKTLQVEDLPITHENGKDSTNLKGPRSIKVHRLEEDLYVILQSCKPD